MKKRAILFDLDDTLYTYEIPHQKGLKAAYLFLNKTIKLSFNEFLELYNISKDEIQRELSGTASCHNRVLYFQRLIEKTKNTVDPEVILPLYNAYWNTFLTNMKLDKEVMPLFFELKKRSIKIAIVSDLTTHIQLRKVQKLGLSEPVDVLVTSEEAGREKPHPSVFLFALNKLNLLPNEVIMVGDDIRTDIEGANATGIESVLLLKNKANIKEKQYFRKPTHTIKHISEVTKFLD